MPIFEPESIYDVSLLAQHRAPSLTGTPDQVFDRDRMLMQADAIYDAHVDVFGSGGLAGIDQAAEQTEAFVRRAFDMYDGSMEAPHYDWVFAVHGRDEEDGGLRGPFENNQYASEVTPFLPLLDPKFGVSAGVRQRFVAGLVPSVIEEYQGVRTFGAQHAGAVVWTPLYIDRDARRDGRWSEYVAMNKRVIGQMADFSQHRLGAQAMGLGASLPAFTRLGKEIADAHPGLETTTGHAGTVYLLTETVNEVIDRSGRDIRHVAILGVGAIGSATLDMLLASERDYTVTVYDIDERKLDRIRYNEAYDVRVRIAANGAELLGSADVIVSAINSDSQLASLEFMHTEGKRIDLSGKIIIDDSQPGAFSRQEVEDHGGRLVWVVGQDTSRKQPLKRVGGYNFGDHSGMIGDGAVWGCEAEVGAIALGARSELSVRSHVTPEQVVAVGGLLHQAGIRVARPYQSYSQPVSIEPGFALVANDL